MKNPWTSNSCWTAYAPSWMNEPYYSFRAYLQEKFPASRVLKIPIDAGLGCPNRDGTLSRDGCIFCDRYGSGPIRQEFWPIERQIESFLHRHPGKKFIAYYQSHCNTTGPVAELRKKYEIVFRYTDIVGLYVGTRPDAIAPPVHSLLAEMGKRIYLAVELGLQSIHRQSLLWLNRNHSYKQFVETFRELKSRRLDVIVHLIIGIPGETIDHMRATIAAMNDLKPSGVKFHLLHVLRGTRLHDHYVRAPFPLLKREEYADILVDLLENLDPGIVVHRLTGERQKELFVAPLWAMDKVGFLRFIGEKMRALGAYQGKRLAAC